MRGPGAAAWTAVASLLLAGLLGFGGVSVAAAPQQVRPGGAVAVHAAGFAPGGAVMLRLAGARGGRTLHADRHGRVSTTYRAPQRAGRYRLLLVGAPPSGRAPAPPRGRGPGDRQAVAVTVPRLVLVAFVVQVPRPSSGAGAGHTSANPGGAGAGGASASAGPHAGDPAVTGADVGLLAVLALVLVGLGSAFVLGGVRPRRR